MSKPPLLLTYVKTEVQRGVVIAKLANPIIKESSMLEGIEKDFAGLTKKYGKQQIFLDMSNVWDAAYNLMVPIYKLSNDLKKFSDQDCPKRLVVYGINPGVADIFAKNGPIASGLTIVPGQQDAFHLLGETIKCPTT